MRGKRRGKCGKRWYVDSTYLRIEGRWCYLYRAIDKLGVVAKTSYMLVYPADKAIRIASHG